MNVLHVAQTKSILFRELIIFNDFNIIGLIMISINICNHSGHYCPDKFNCTRFSPYDFHLKPVFYDSI